jgi:hypothetical protein
MEIVVEIISIDDVLLVTCWWCACAILGEVHVWCSGFEHFLCDPHAIKTSAYFDSKTPWLDSKTPWLDSKTPWLDSITPWVDSKTPWLDKHDD